VTVYLTESERKTIEALAAASQVEPGTRCPTCNRRVNKPRTEESPSVREIRIRLPEDRIEPVEEAFDALQEITGVDPYSYPKGTLLEALLLLGGQHREELAAHFRGES
jgi:hypothetical protein